MMTIDEILVAMPTGMMFLREPKVLRRVMVLRPALRGPTARQGNLPVENPAPTLVRAWDAMRVNPWIRVLVVGAKRALMAIGAADRVEMIVS